MPSAAAKIEKPASQEGQDSLKSIVTIFEKKTRNLEKRKVRSVTHHFIFLAVSATMALHVMLSLRCLRSPFLARNAHSTRRARRFRTLRPVRQALTIALDSTLDGFRQEKHDFKPKLGQRTRASVLFICGCIASRRPEKKK